MYELFLTSAVADGDLQMSCAVLQGYTWMRARSSIERVQFYAGPRQPHPKGLPVTKLFQRPNNNPAAGSNNTTSIPFPWQALSKEFSRSSYVIQVAYEVAASDFGSGVELDLNAQPGTLHWTDFPEPLRDTPVTQRKKIDVANHANLPAILTDNKHECIRELILETLTFVRENTEFVFSRWYRLPDQSAPQGSLPSWDTLQPVDPELKWMLAVKLCVLEDNDPEKIKAAMNELLELRTKMEALFEFKPVDRRDFDTRVPPPGRTY